MPPDAPYSCTPSVPLGSRPARRSYLVSRDSPDYLNTLACVRCGLCLAVCPTYAVEKVEAQSPRGRVALIRAASEGRLDVRSPILRDHVYNCLDCRACETICPSGVRVGHLVLGARAESEQATHHSFVEWIVRLVALRLVLVSGARLAAFTRFARLYQTLGLQRLVRGSGVLEMLPGKLRRLAQVEALVPSIPARPLHRGAARGVPAYGERRHRVGFFLGCVMSALFAETSWKTVEVLRWNGFEVVTPPDQWCCGAPHAEEGDFASQRRFARHNVDLFARHDLDFVVTDCAACGAETKGYGTLLSRRAGLCGEGGRLQRQGPGHLRATVGDRARAAHSECRRQGDLPRAVSPLSRPGDSKAAERPASLDPRARAGRASRERLVLRQRRSLQRHARVARGQAARPEDRERGSDGRRRGGHGESRMPAPAESRHEGSSLGTARRASGRAAGGGLRNRRAERERRSALGRASADETRLRAAEGMRV